MDRIRMARATHFAINYYGPMHLDGKFWCWFGVFSWGQRQFNLILIHIKWGMTLTMMCSMLSLVTHARCSPLSIDGDEKVLPLLVITFGALLSRIIIKLDVFDDSEEISTWKTQLCVNVN